MKKIAFALIAALALVGCNLDDDPGTQLVLSPIEDVTMPSSYKVDSTSQIMIRYKRPSDCHIFSGIFVETNNFKRNIAIEFAKLSEPDCQADSNVYEIPLNFKPTVAGTYHFRFWNGRTADGTDTFYEADAVVED